MRDNFFFIFCILFVVSISVVSADSQFSFNYMGTNDFYISILPSSEQFNQMEGFGVNLSLTNYNVTSNNVLGDSDVWDLGKVNISTDLLSFVFTTSFKTNCSARLDVEQNYTEMIAANPNYKLATTNTTDHAGTLFDSISEGEHALYISCLTISTGEGALPGNSSSGPLNITLTLPTLANQINYTNDRLTYVHSAQFDQNGQCTLWGNWTGVWAQNESVSAIADVRFNFTAITHQTLDTNILWSLNCSNVGGFESWGSNISYTTGNLDLFLNGLAQGRKYELGTHANLSLTSSGTACLSIYHPDYGEDYSCGSSISVNFSTEPLYIYRFKESGNLLEIVNMSTNYTIYLNDIDNRTGLLEFNLSVTTADTITDLSLSHKGMDLVKLIGDLTGSNLEINRFADRSDAKNLTFREAGTQFVYLNTTSVGRMINCTLDVSGSDTDKDNAFSFLEDFNDTEFLNMTENTLGAPHGFYDNFWWNVTGRWDIIQVCEGADGGYSCDPDTYKAMFPGYMSLDSNPPADVIGTSNPAHTVKTETISFNADNKSFIHIPISLDNQNTISGSGCGCGNSNFIYLVDGTNTVTLVDLGNPDFENRNYTFFKADSDTWYRFNNGTYEAAIDVSSLNPAESWEIKFSIQSSSQTCNTRDACNARFIANVDFIRTSGIYPFIEQEWLNYSSTGTMRSLRLNETKTPIISATLFAHDFTKAFLDNVTFYLSNDDTTWEEVTVGVVHTFTTTGNNISYMINYSLFDNRSQIYISRVGIDIIPGSAHDVTVNLGNDDNIEFNWSGELNSSNSPQLVNLSAVSMELYRDENCGETQPLCLIPIVVGAGKASIVELDTISCNIDVNPMSLNKTIIEDANGSIPIDVNYSSPGTINLTTLRLKFYGENIINITASLGSNAVSYLLNVMYSSFNVAINPPNIDYWDIGPNLYSWIQSYVPPFGNGNGDGNPFWNITRTIWEEPVDVYIRYNESVNTCATTWFSGLNETNTSLSFNVTINTTTQILFNNVTDKLQNNVSSWTNISCASANSTLLFPYFCFSGLCTDCVKTEDWTTLCDWTG